MNTRVILLLGLVLSVAAVAQPPRGVLVEQVAAAADPKQTYALYLPAGYSEERRWPAILVFDPGARGAEAVRVFQAAAERFGWIVLASNNSRNFAPEQTKAAIAALWPEIHDRYATDPRRIYVGGFSGGARRALAIASSPECKGCVAGVVACGAGIAGELDFAATGTPAFLSAGLYDFNYDELEELASAMDRRQAPYRFRTFDGAHRWMPASEAEAALAWFELRAMAEGRLPRNSMFIEARWQAEMSEARAVQEKDALDAVRLHRGIVADYGRLRDVAEARSAVAALEASKALKQAQRQRRKEIQRGKDLTDPAMAMMNRMEEAEPFERRALALRLRVLSENLASRLGKTKDESERRALRRSAGALLGTGYETAESAMRAGKREFAGAVLGGVAPLASEEYGRKYLAARGAALSGDGKRALALLRQALDAGLPQTAAFAQDPAFAQLREKAEFKELTR